jgi:3-deoxy-7-phosphoheptulonate synthase
MLPATTLNSTLPLVSPRALALELVPEKVSLDTVESASSTVKEILEGKDKRLLVVAGPCSVHDRESALEYASKLAQLRNRYIDRIYILMRVYFEKPRSTVGWKGMIYDPDMDGSCDMASGLRAARKLLMSITEMGLPAGMEILNPIVSCYIADLVSWASVVPAHREPDTQEMSASSIASRGQKQYRRSLESAVTSIEASRLPHSFLSIDCSAGLYHQNRGNPWSSHFTRGKSGPITIASRLSMHVNCFQKSDDTLG